MKRLLRIVLVLVAFLLLILAVIVVFVLVRWNHPDDRRAPLMAALRDSVTVARGEHLFKDSWQCWGCHASPPADANTVPSGGLAFDLRKVGPGFGIFYGTNLTPDSATGIGGWTDGELVQAIREGVRRDHRVLFPIMSDYLYGLSDSDALAIVAYMRSIPPVRHAVPQPEPSFVAKVLFAFGIIKPRPAITSPVQAPPPGPTAAYGQYFANYAAGCADCHTPRNLANGEFYRDSAFTGSSIAYGSDIGSLLQAYAGNIRPDIRTGIGSWSAADFVAAVTMGILPDSTMLAVHMPYADYKFLTPDELQAIYLYLKSLPPIPRSAPPPAYTGSYAAVRGAARGKLLFALRCQACHGVDGEGARPTSMKLKEAALSLGDGDLHDIIAGGLLDNKMPPFRKTLTATDTDDLVAYMRSWE